MFVFRWAQNGRLGPSPYMRGFFQKVLILVPNTLVPSTWYHIVHLDCRAQDGKCQGAWALVNQIID